VYADVPFTLTMYTPLYFHIVAALPAAPDAPFLAGRLVSLVSMLGAAALLFAVPRRRAGTWLPALAAACFLLVWIVGQYAAAMRIDALAVALSACGVTLARRRTPRAVAGAALCCLLALATKQSHVAAAVACVTWLALQDRPLAARFAAWLAGGLLLGAGAASLLWGRGFWFSTVTATMDSPQWWSVPAVWGAVLQQPLFAVLCALAALTAAARVRRDGVRGALRSLELCYAVLATLLSSLALAKTGSSAIYFIEPALALLLWLLAAWADVPASEPPAHGAGAPRGAPAVPAAARAAPMGARVRGAAFGAVAVAVALELATSASHRGRITLAAADPQADRAFAAGMRAALEREAPGRPLVLNLGPPHFAYYAAQDTCLNDSFLYTLLWTTGRLGPEPLVAAIEARRFDVVLLSSLVDAAPEPPPPWDRIVRTVRERYVLRGRDPVYQCYGR
ncbi:MAG TPA: hypothetical protein VK824_06610, partial [Planctomycetota bacterium]|nr:hypothetical protein [Planctomycetota bacterium]